jgi:hypothetical protein
MMVFLKHALYSQVGRLLTHDRALYGVSLHDPDDHAAARSFDASADVSSDERSEGPRQLRADVPI